MSDRDHKRRVREGYQAVLERTSRRTSDGAATGSSVGRAEALGYDAESVRDLPDSAIGASFGCGNPLAFAEVQEGDTVVDIGSGAGMDCLVAARAVGATGRVIGVDMTPDMIVTAADNARKAGVRNVDFRLGDADALPVDDASVDWVVSNCVINLTPNKSAVFAEIARVLKPGGRVSITDIVIDGPLPPAVVENVEALIGCVAGAVEEKAYVQGMVNAGLDDVKVTARTAVDPRVLGSESDCGCDCGCGDSNPRTAKAADSLDGLLDAHADDLRGKVWSARVTARKPE